VWLLIISPEEGRLAYRPLCDRLGYPGPQAFEKKTNIAFDIKEFPYVKDRQRLHRAVA
jgi:hypothetical protein